MSKQKAFHLKVEQRVMWVSAYQLWTKSTAQQYVREFRHLVLPVIGKPWAVVLDIREWQICPADAFAVLIDNTKWCFANHLQHVCIIGAENTMVMWQFAKATQAEKPAGVVSENVADEQAARQALTLAGYLTDAN